MTPRGRPLDESHIRGCLAGLGWIALGGLVFGLVVNIIYEALKYLLWS